MGIYGNDKWYKTCMIVKKKPNALLNATIHDFSVTCKYKCPV